jgi:magnesium transporter
LQKLDTLLSAIFLPLNLLVGFFGMNTTSLPFSQSEGGTYSVLAILFVVAIIATLLAYFIKNR